MTSTKVEKKKKSEKRSFMSMLKGKSKLHKQVDQLLQRKIGDYHLGPTLGMGGYSKVKLGIHHKTGLKVALKIMFADESGKVSDSKLKQLKRELKTMQKVSHQNVIKLIEYDENAKYPEYNGKTKNCVVTVLEYASGGELFDFLMFTGHFDEVASRSYFHQFMAGLNAMHSKGLAHRDLKPENLLMDSNFVLKIADFGFATNFVDKDGKEQKMKTACGTKGYLAPELLLGKKYNEKCDIFAAGIILFTIYAGFPPFQNAVDTDWWWNKLLRKKYKLFWMAHERSRQFPSDLKELLRKMVYPKPHKRPDIKGLKEFDWYNGKTYSQKQLQAYLTKRRKVVMKERAKKIKQQQQNQNYDSEEITNRNGDTLTRKQVYQSESKKLDKSNEYLTNIDYLSDGLFTNSAYQFETTELPRLVATRLKAYCLNVNINIETFPKNNLTYLRAAASNENENDDVIVAVKQFIVDEVEEEDEKDDDEEEEEEDEDEDEDDDDDDEDDDEDDDDSDKKKKKKKKSKKETKKKVSDKKLTYIVSFKRLTGQFQNYKKLMEEIWVSKEIVPIMKIDDLTDE